MKLAYPACFYEEKDGGYSVEIPDLPCATCGDNLADAVEMAIDAASGWILTSLEDGERIPKPTNPKDVKLEYDNGFVSILVLDMDAYTEKYGESAVRKNVTIPAYLNTLAEKENINFSHVLQESLKEKLHLKQ